MAAVRLAVGEAPPQLARAIGRPMTAERQPDPLVHLHSLPREDPACFNPNAAVGTVRSGAPAASPPLRSATLGSGISGWWTLKTVKQDPEWQPKLIPSERHPVVQSHSFDDPVVILSLDVVKGCFVRHEERVGSSGSPIAAKNLSACGPRFLISVSSAFSTIWPMLRARQYGERSRNIPVEFADRLRA